jgi:hypothetical protein
VCRVLFVVAVIAVEVREPVMSPDRVPVRVSAGVVVGFVTVPVNPFALTKLNEVTVPPASVLEIVKVPDPGTMLMPVPATRVSAPTCPFRLETPLDPPVFDGYLAYSDTLYSLTVYEGI